MDMERLEKTLELLNVIRKHIRFLEEMMLLERPSEEMLETLRREYANEAVLQRDFVRLAAGDETTRRVE